jgi:N-acyl homoserine lactone hydrolase
MPWSRMNRGHKVDKVSRHKLRAFAQTVLTLLVAICFAGLTIAQAHKTELPGQARTKANSLASLRLYVFDCGRLKVSDPSAYGFAPNELGATDMSVPCFLIVHPKGTLIWDAGVVPDSMLTPGQSVTLVSPSGASKGQTAATTATATESLKAQLANIGYAPEDITYFAVSHCHWDHTANANEFAGAIWLVRQKEWDAMFSQPSTYARCLTPQTYSALKNSPTVILKNDEYDVFGDGTVIIQSAPGHTPGHQVLVVKLSKSGTIVLSGDLYHYPEERSQHHVPKTDFNPDQTAASRVKIEAYLKKTGAELWIQHDFKGNAKLKKAPAYYD